MSQKMLAKNFKWVKNISKFAESFIKSNTGQSDKGYFLKLMFNILKTYIILNWLTLFA